MNKPYAIELFAGAGGLSLGLKQAGFEIVLANEIENDFAQSYTSNHSKTKMLQDDVHNINFKKQLENIGIKRISLLAGGPPCQGFSTLGSKNQQDNRNSLFHEFLRAVYEINPDMVLFENVAGFQTMYQGNIYRKLLLELNSLGYKTSSNIVDASDFGLPQKRLRTMIIAKRSNKSKLDFPLATHSNNGNLFGVDKLTLMDALSDLPSIKVGKSEKKYAKEPKNNYQQVLRKNTTTLTEHNCANYGQKMQEILSLIPTGGSINDIPLRLRPKKYFSNTYARLLPDELAPTITRNFGTPSSSRCVHPFENRALSTREGARLQGFPDDYYFYGSKTSKNLQIGNAVPPVLAKQIAKQMINQIN